jgi:glycosyltransferase involved in cell wall biosynthesis
MNILVVSSYYLFKDTRFGGAKRLYYLTKELERHGAVHVICHDGSGEYAPGLASDFDRFLFLPVDDTRNFFAKLVRPGFNIERFLDRNSSRIGHFLGSVKFDAVLLAFPLALSFVKTMLPPQTRPVVYLEDDLLAETIRMENKHGILNPYISIRLAQLHSYYARRLSLVDTFVTISSQEQQIVGRLFPDIRTATVGYGIPLADYPFCVSRPPRFTLGFIGNFRHRPNADAVEWFLTAVYPECRKMVPDIRALVAGKDIPASFQNRFANDASVMWEENVALLHDFYGRISVLVNPSVSGRGLRTKVIEAAAFGRPVVSTSLGAEGLSDLAIDIADDPVRFAECCGRLAVDQSRYADIAAANRRTVEREYSIETVSSRLVKLLQRKP